MSYQLEPIDENSWLLVDDELNQSKLINNIDDDVYVIDDNRIIMIDDPSTLDVILAGGQIKLPDDDTEYFVGGFAVTHVKPHDAKIISGLNLPVYTKRKNSETYYCAGYYCVNYENGWKWTNSVMLITLLQNEFRGPFHTKEKTLEVLKSLQKSN